MELGFSNDVDTLSVYRSIQDRKIARYKQLLGDSVMQELRQSFFDVIVITAIDEEQKAHYERMIKQKIEQRLIPSFVKYFVIADPVGAKIGCGGSTLYTLACLSQLLTPDVLSNTKVLLLHAGGYSKRLPNHSTSGKIFASLPFQLEPNGVAITMLEMKIIILIDFPISMKPGIFLACSDDIELFESKGMTMTAPGFTALAHPGTIDVGLGHGIFILEHNDKYTPNQPNKCVRYLHKPSKAKMEQEGAILPNNQVLLDSCYFFDSDTTKLLLAYYNANSPIQCEIDAYSDFLQPLGSCAKGDYFENKNNVTVYTPLIAQERKKLFDLLNNNHTQLTALPLNPSSFIHIGTCHEYIEHFTLNFPKIGSVNVVYSRLDDSKLIDANSVLIHCLFDQGRISIQSSSVLEYCQLINVNASIGQRCIVSDIEYKGDGKGASLTIPSNTFIQTLCINNKGYVTVLFGVDDALKATSNPTFLGAPLQQLLTKHSLATESVWKTDDHSLWTASLFPLCASPTESVIGSLALLGDAATTQSSVVATRYSLEQCLSEKDLLNQSSRRARLTESIKNK
ncbi:hypothetical protein SAMD00019534_111030 [Acytostelium subglobosum LB1]|uniref:hypothetical protein n=1 Tax=Acytostelium subglobosum LB1 TaxID=1410327 RepID=UPI000644C272|nr:hypothetical protein SAMD00019534_111030 [Acytostelium subglobosum LB1]GAM27927.1 hypothetical protein SAMD00019534_111030 [Acytostelium subglobosum LB1]|eukprot:XP_012749210.1 hypothetical protein SAMD00019534_111030 [Acytostelium subglobosum LB1]